jgi:hypothetical protein
MGDYLAVAIAAVPVQTALGILNTQTRWLTRGEVRFWCVVIFLAAELIYLGAGR